jgi:hypothetical protein
VVGAGTPHPELGLVGDDVGVAPAGAHGDNGFGGERVAGGRPPNVLSR